MRAASKPGSVGASPSPIHASPFATGFMSFTSEQVATVSVAKDGSKVVVLGAREIKKNGKVLIEPKVEIEPLAAGAGVPTGTVTLNRLHGKHKFLGAAQLSGGKATPVDNQAHLHANLFMMNYSGDADFEASMLPVTITVG